MRIVGRPAYEWEEVPVMRYRHIVVRHCPVPAGCLFVAHGRSACPRPPRRCWSPPAARAATPDERGLRAHHPRAHQHHRPHPAGAHRRGRHPPTVTQFGPTNFPDNVDPFTGLQVADASVLNRRPLAVKVSEFPRRVRPQDGLSLADLVFEHYAEAGVSRMTAIFLGNDSPKVGSIRSARLIDLVLTEFYKAMLITSGSSPGVLHRPVARRRSTTA